LVDLDKRELIAILPNRTQACISECLKSWGAEVLSQIIEVSIDGSTELAMQNRIAKP
jgi:transposase